jgi:predicted DNA-binding transcriptional regulator AlpA
VSQLVAQIQQSLLLTQPQAWRFVGLSRTAWFRFKGQGLLPKPVNLPGCDQLFRRSELERFVERLGSAAKGAVRA